MGEIPIDKMNLGGSFGEFQTEGPVDRMELNRPRPGIMAKVNVFDHQMYFLKIRFGALDFKITRFGSLGPPRDLVSTTFTSFGVGELLITPSTASKFPRLPPQGYSKRRSGTHVSLLNRTRMSVSGGIMPTVGYWTLFPSVA